MRRSFGKANSGLICAAVFLVVSSMFIAQEALAVEYTITTIDMPYSAPAYAKDINNSGQVVGLYDDGETGHGFLYSNGVATKLDPPWASPRGGFSLPLGINKSGQIVGYVWGAPSEFTGFLYSGGVFTHIDVPSALHTYPQHINDNGKVVGSYDDINNVRHGFLYSGGTFTTLDVPSSTATSPSRINNSGQVVGSYTGNNGVVHGFLYSGGVFTTLDGPSARHTDATDINDKGQVVGWYTDNNGITHGFLYSGGVFMTLDGSPAPYSTQANGINNRGQITGTTDIYAFMYSNGAFSTFDAAPGPGLGSWGTRINDRGQIIGGYPLNQGRSFIANPVVKTVKLDIIPRLPNIITLWPNWGIIPVTIFSTQDFSAPKSVDPHSLTFGDTGSQDSFAFCDPFNLDINRDGYRDLTCYFQKQYTGFKCGDTQGVLEGMAMDGTPIKGSDSVKVVPCR